MKTNQNVSVLAVGGGIPVTMIENTSMSFQPSEYSLEGRINFGEIEERVPTALMSNEEFTHVMSSSFLESLNRDRFYLAHHLNQHGLPALTYFFYDDENLNDWHKYTEEIAKNPFFKWNPGIRLIYFPKFPQK